MDEARIPIEMALARLGEELASRRPDNLGIRVSEPADLPHVAALARLINRYGRDVGEFLEKEDRRHRQRSDELMQAYNAMQGQQDEMNRELAMARSIQLRLLPMPAELPDRPEVACGGFYDSMRNVGGDLYDIIRVGLNSYGLLIADVSGHGVPAALITALVKISFRTKIRWGVSTAEVCRRVNEELQPLLSDLDFYVTAFFLIVDLEAGEVEYTNCGHHPALLLRVSEDEPVPLDTPGRFLGAFDDAEYVSERLTLEAQDLILAYTDGIIESRNLMDEEYGYDRLISCLLETGIDHPARLVESVRRDLDGFCMGAEARDDRTMAAIQFLARAAPDGEPSVADAAYGAARQAPGEAVARLRREIPAAIGRKEWTSALGFIKALDLLGAAGPGHLASLAAIYFRGGLPAPAREAARRALALADGGSAGLSPALREQLGSILRRTGG
jgi:serine phosphatase RsbU (regulator of sigma subunit)